METGDLTRPHDWPERLDAFTQSAAEQEFVWGTYDCCLFAADWLRILTGVDPAQRLRGTYSSAEETEIFIAEAGGIEALIDDAMRDFLGVVSSEPSFCRRGDICLVDTPLGYSLSVCLGEHAACAGLDGMVTVSMRHAVRCWRVL